MELCVELSIVLGQNSDHFREAENVAGYGLENVTENVAALSMKRKTWLGEIFDREYFFGEIFGVLFNPSPTFHYPFNLEYWNS